jgi:hypothetical protein
MARFDQLVAAEMFLPIRIYEAAFDAFARQATKFLTALEKDNPDLTAEQRLEHLIQAQAAGLLPPMPELLDYSGEGTYIVEEARESQSNVTAGVTLNAITVGVNLARRTQSVEKITHHVSWKARAVLPDRDRLEALVANHAKLREKYKEE